MFTILNPVIFMVDRFIGLSDLRSSDKSIKILVDHCKIEIRSSPLPSVQLFTILCHICNVTFSTYMTNLSKFLIFKGP